MIRGLFVNDPRGMPSWPKRSCKAPQSSFQTIHPIGSLDMVDRQFFAMWEPFQFFLWGWEESFLCFNRVFGAFRDFHGSDSFCKQPRGLASCNPPWFGDQFWSHRLNGSLDLYSCDRLGCLVLVIIAGNMGPTDNFLANNFGLTILAYPMKNLVWWSNLASCRSIWVSIVSSFSKIYFGLGSCFILWIISVPWSSLVQGYCLRSQYGLSFYVRSLFEGADGSWA